MIRTSQQLLLNHRSAKSNEISPGRIRTGCVPLGVPIPHDALRPWAWSAPARRTRTVRSCRSTQIRTASIPKKTTTTKPAPLKKHLHQKFSTRLIPSWSFNGYTGLCSHSSRYLVLIQTVTPGVPRSGLWISEVEVVGVAYES